MGVSREHHGNTKSIKPGLTFPGSPCQPASEPAPQGGMTMQELQKKISRRTASFVVAALMAGAATGSFCYADMVSTNAAVRPNNSLLVDVHVTTGASVAQVLITY